MAQMDGDWIWCNGEPPARQCISFPSAQSSLRGCVERWSLLTRAQLLCRKRGTAGRVADRTGAVAPPGVSESGSAALRRALGDRDREAGGAAHQAADTASDLEPFLWHS
jgi:hypothetical protein